MNYSKAPLSPNQPKMGKTVLEGEKEILDSFLKKRNNWRKTPNENQSEEKKIKRRSYKERACNS